MKTKRINEGKQDASHKKRKGFWGILLVLVICTVSVTAGILVPRYVLAYQTTMQEGQVLDAPREYYEDASSAMSRSASEQLSSLDRFKLATGAWESEYSLSTKDKAFLTETEAVELAKSQLEIYYKGGLYPYSLDSQYGNWYSFTTKVYECIDTSFHTYAAYVWVIDFTKYDHSLTHEIYMTDSGTILLAKVNENAGLKGNLKFRLRGMDLQKVLGINSKVYQWNLDDEIEISMENISIPGYEPDSADVVEGCKVAGGSKDGEFEFRVLRFVGEDYYGIAIMP